MSNAAVGWWCSLKLAGLSQWLTERWRDGEPQPAVPDLSHQFFRTGKIVNHPEPYKSDA